jgi:dTMP kinase
MVRNITHKFISFEGIDYAGKSTQIQRLAERLTSHGQKVVTLREPGGTIISERIREILLDKRHDEMHPSCELLLYSAARIQILHQRIIPELQKGKFVLIDRYIDSTTTYQGYGRRQSLVFINKLHRFAVSHVFPAITFYLDLKPAEMMQRKITRGVMSDRLETAGEQFYRDIYEGYKKLADMYSKRIKVINANRSIHEIAQEIWEFVRQKYAL